MTTRAASTDSSHTTSPLGVLAGLLALGVGLLAPAFAQADGAADSNTVLIDATGSATTAAQRTEALALGLTVEQVTDPAVWNAKTEADFRTYKAIVIPDNTCNGVSATAIASRTTWSKAISGNILIIGGDPEFHYNYGNPGGGPSGLIRNGIKFAADDAGKTGLYVALGCSSSSGTVLDPFGAFGVGNMSSDSIHIVASHPALDGLSDALLSNWGSSTHLKFTSFPSNFVPLAIQTNGTNPGVMSFGDGTSGTPFLLVRGSSVLPVGLSMLGSAPGTIEAGAALAYTFTYGNTGGSDATGVVITAPVPAGTSFASASGGGSLAGGVVTWNVGTVPVGTTGQTVSLTVTPSSAGTVTLSGATITDGTVTGTAGAIVTTVTAPPSICGDGVVEGAETCDDGNIAAGDGCSATCRVEPGFTCAVAGEPCALYPAAVAAWSGSGQSAVVGTAFAADVCVMVYDLFDLPLPGQAVSFSAAASGASATFPGSVLSDAAGVACSPASANTVTGSYAVQAVSGAATGAVGGLTNLADAPATHTLVGAGGAAQQVVVGHAFADLAVVIRDQYGNLVPGTPVDFVKAGAATGGFLAILSSASAVTDAGGFASVGAVANNFVGAESIHLRYGPVLASGVFALSAGPDVPAAVVADWGSAPQSAPVGGTTFAQPVGATVRDRWGNVVPGVTVLFSSPRSGPSCLLSAFTDVSDGAGHAVVVATSRDLAGSYLVTASVGAISAGFWLTNATEAANPVSLSTSAGGAGAQHAPVGAPFGSPLTVTVSDLHGNPVAGVAVTFSAPASGPSAALSALSQVTDAFGKVTIGATANTVAGSYVVTASAEAGAAPVAFQLVNDPGAPARLVASPLAATQSAAVATSFARPLAVTVEDGFANPVPGVAVAFSAPTSGVSAQLSLLLAVSDAAGVAQVEALAGRTAGSYPVTAASPGATGVSFSLANLPGAAGSLAIVGGSAQEATVTAAFGTPLRVVVRDRFGNVVPGVSVSFSAPATQASASLSLPAVTTGLDGQCLVDATAGRVAGAYLVTASAEGVAAPVQFGLVNRPGAAASLQPDAGSAGQSARVGEPFAVPAAVTVVDAHGNTVPGAAVGFACPSASACTVDAAPVASDAAGRAWARVTAGSAPGSLQVTASAPGLPSVDFALTNLVGAPGSIEVVSGSSQQSPVFASFAAPLGVRVKDQFGNAVPGAPVAFELVSGGLQSATLSASSAATAADGSAAISAVANFAQGGYQVRATAPGVATPVVFELANRPLQSRVTVQVALPVNATVVQGGGITHLRVLVDTAGGLLPPGAVTLRSSTPLIVVAGQADVSQSGDAVVAVLRNGSAEVDVQIADWRSRSITADFAPDASGAPTFTPATVTQPLVAPEKELTSGGCSSGGAGSLAGLLLLALAMATLRRAPARLAARRAALLGLLVVALLPGVAAAQATFGLRLAYASSAGSAIQGSPMSEGIRSSLPIQLDVGYRILPFLQVGAYGSWGSGTVGSLCGAGSCSASVVRAGVQAAWRFGQLFGLDPWAGAGLGWEQATARSTVGADTLQVTFSGWELLNLQLGADIALGKGFSVGPYLQGSVGRYGSQEVKSPLGDSSGTIADPTNHSWLSFGVRGTYDL